jgi:hypothetical protein
MPLFDDMNSPMTVPTRAYGTDTFSPVINTRAAVGALINAVLKRVETQVLRWRG